MLFPVSDARRFNPDDWAALGSVRLAVGLAGAVSALAVPARGAEAGAAGTSGFSAGGVAAASFSNSRARFCNSAAPIWIPC